MCLYNKKNMKIIFALGLIFAIRCNLFEKIESLVNSKEDEDEYNMFKMNNDPIPHKQILNLYPKFDSPQKRIDEINKLIVKDDKADEQFKSIANEYQTKIVNPPIIKQTEKTKKEDSIIETPPIF